MLPLQRKIKEADEVQSRALWVSNNAQGRVYKATGDPHSCDDLAFDRPPSWQALLNYTKNNNRSSLLDARIERRHDPCKRIRCTVHRRTAVIVPMAVSFRRQILSPRDLPLIDLPGKRDVLHASHFDGAKGRQGDALEALREVRNVRLPLGGGVRLVTLVQKNKTKPDDAKSGPHQQGQHMDSTKLKIVATSKRAGTCFRQRRARAGLA